MQRVFLGQLYTFGEPNRDPRARVVTVAYYALVDLRDYQLSAATDAEDAAWFDVVDLLRLAFEHNLIIHIALC